MLPLPPLAIPDILLFLSIPEDGNSDYSDTLQEAGQKKVNHVKATLKGKEVMASTTVKRPRGRPPKRGNARK